MEWNGMGRKGVIKELVLWGQALVGGLFEVAAHGFFFVDVFDNVALVRIMW